MLTHAARLCLCWSGATGGVAMCSCSTTRTAARLNRFSTTESRSRLRRQPRRSYRSGGGWGVWMGSLGRNWVCPAVPDLMLGFLNGAFHYAVGVGFYDVPNDIRDGL